MNGLSMLTSGQVAGPPSAASEYQTLGFPDLNGDLKDDIVIQHIQGYTFGYISNGVDVASASGPIPGPPEPDSGYSTIGFPNLDDDNGADVVIQHTTGFTYAYLMGETGLGDAIGDGQVPGPPNQEVVDADIYLTQPWGESWTAFDAPLTQQ